MTATAYRELVEKLRDAACTRRCFDSPDGHVIGLMDEAAAALTTQGEEIDATMEEIGHLRAEADRLYGALEKIAYMKVGSLVGAGDGETRAITGTEYVALQKIALEALSVQPIPEGDGT